MKPRKKHRRDKQKKREGRKQKLNESVIFLEKINEQKHQKLEEMSMLHGKRGEPSEREEADATTTGGNILDELRQPASDEPEPIEPLVFEASKKNDDAQSGRSNPTEPDGSARKFCVEKKKFKEDDNILPSVTMLQKKQSISLNKAPKQQAAINSSSSQVEANKTGDDNKRSISS